MLWSKKCFRKFRGQSSVEGGDLVLQTLNIVEHWTFCREDENIELKNRISPNVSSAGPKFISSVCPCCQPHPHYHHHKIEAIIITLAIVCDPPKFISFVCFAICRVTFFTFVYILLSSLSPPYHHDHPHPHDMFPQSHSTILWYLLDRADMADCLYKSSILCILV